MQRTLRLAASLVLMVFSFSAMANWPLADGEGNQLPSLAPMLKKVNPAVVNISTFAKRHEQNPL